MAQPSDVVTRFAPSPTGFLHIGGVRTALFNWLFARHHQGRYLLRIEDTDRKRSTDDAIAAILDGLEWMGLDWDGDVVYQSKRAERHAEAARGLLARGGAYLCFATPEELAEMRELAKAEGRSMRYDGRWRDRDPADAPPGIEPVVRFKAPRDGETVIEDRIQGTVRVANAELDDMILLRSDGTPTYMLSVVVDDHVMGITVVIRGVDHLTNSFRQAQLYAALGFAVPTFAHMPLLHGADGAKLSKRHGALGVEAYRDMGILPEAMFNYLLRLGWSHGDDEIISRDDAIRWFTLEAVGRSAARFDMERLRSLNAHYIRESDDERLLELALPQIEAAIGGPVDAAGRERLARGLAGLKPRAATVNELAEKAAFYVAPRPLALTAKAQKQLSGEALAHLAALAPGLAALETWDADSVETQIRAFVEDRGLKLGAVAQPLRAALTGKTESPGLFELLDVLGRDESLARLADVTAPTDA
ncbi:MAG: glutamate--tRNA ligase [Alphaproteobacteria bacterium]|nr:glutamate--tRNA ligase [Alphaproteobacteria bacterium]